MFVVDSNLGPFLKNTQNNRQIVKNSLENVKYSKGLILVNNDDIGYYSKNISGLFHKWYLNDRLGNKRISRWNSITKILDEKYRELESQQVKLVKWD
jgi:hypothetical protein